MGKRLNGKTILVTAAAQGIGKACAIKFLKEGYKVAVLARKKNKLEFTFFFQQKHFKIFWLTI